MYFQLNHFVIYYKLNQSPFCFALIVDPNTLFRSNSLASKAMEQFMKVCQRIHSFFVSGTVSAVCAVKESKINYLKLTIFSHCLLPSSGI